MIAGIVTHNLKAAIHIVLLDEIGQQQEVEVFVDTGFNGDLALSSAIITDAGFSLLEETEVQLADGREVTLQVFEGRVDWQGSNRKADVIASEGDPLLGMRLLEGSELRIEVKSGGAVRIEPLE